MRICLVVSVPLPPEGGLGYHVWNLAQQLIEKGHHVEFITRGNLTPTMKDQMGGITIWRVSFAPAYPFHVHLHSIFVNKLFAQIESEFDIVNMHTPLPPVIKTGLPVVTTVHSPMLADTSATHGFDLRTIALRGMTPVMERIERALFARSQKITAVASWVAQELERYGVNPGEVVITGNGVEDSFLGDTYIGQRKPYVLCVGRLDIGKGVEDLIQAARLVLQRRSDSGLRFLIVGKGPLLSKLRNLVAENGLEQHVEFRDYLGANQRDQLVELYRQAAVFVLPSHHEGMPTVLLEAMATGTPAISTAVGGALEVVLDGENGLLVPPREPEALANAIIRVLEEPEFGMKIGCNGRDTVKSEYSWSAISDRYINIYEQVLHGSGLNS